MLAVEICSACYYVDDTFETIVGNAICADGAAAFLLAGGPQATRSYPQIIDFETCESYWEPRFNTWRVP
jgi:predicted naringenin-chalcone synthase